MVASSCGRNILNMEAVSSSRNFREFVQDYTASHYRTRNFHKKCRVNLTSQHFPLGVNAGTFVSWAVICRPVSAL